MGCICSKDVSDDKIFDGKDKGLAKSLSGLFAPSRKEGSFAAKGTPDGEKSVPKRDESTVALVPVSSEMENMVGVQGALDRTRSIAGHQRRATVGAGNNTSRFGGDTDGEGSLGIGDVPNEFEVEHVATGWPSWLISVATKAMKGWLPRRADSFGKLDKIGQETYSHVYRARDLETSKIVALKKVRFVNMDPESIKFMAREIHIMRKLDHPNVIKLEGLVKSRMSTNLYLVFEYMEHDLAASSQHPASSLLGHR